VQQCPSQGDGGNDVYAELRTALMRRGLEVCEPFVDCLRHLLVVKPSWRASLADFLVGVEGAIDIMRHQA
jgi:hypothetical protein